MKLDQENVIENTLTQQQILQFEPNQLKIWIGCVVMKRNINLIHAKLNHVKSMETGHNGLHAIKYVAVSSQDKELVYQAKHVNKNI